MGGSGLWDVLVLGESILGPRDSSILQFWSLGIDSGILQVDVEP